VAAYRPAATADKADGPPAPSLRPEDVRLYRRMYALAFPGRGRPVCTWGQHALAADQGVCVRTIGNRLRRLVAWGLVGRPRQTTIGHRGGGRIRARPVYVLAVDLDQLARLEAAARNGQAPEPAEQLDLDMPWSDRSATLERSLLEQGHRSATNDEAVSAGGTVRQRATVADVHVLQGGRRRHPGVDPPATAVTTGPHGDRATAGPAPLGAGLPRSAAQPALLVAAPGTTRSDGDRAELRRIVAGTATPRPPAGSDADRQRMAEVRAELADRAANRQAAGG
jgi:hypothetical protein